MANEKNEQQDDLVERLLREVSISDILNVAGVSNLGEDPSPEALHSAMQKLGVFLAGADPLVKETCAAEAIRQLRQCGLDVETARRLVRTALRQQAAPTDDNQFQTFGETSKGAVIVDIVRDADGLAWVVAWPGTGKVEIVKEDALPGRVMWPEHSLPWEGIPDACDVKQALAHQANERELFQVLVDMYRAPPPKRLFVLPEPQGVTAAVLALWVMGTYLLDWFDYYPVLLLEGPHSRGKTRVGNAVIFLARRGMNTSTPTPANIFRHRARHLASYFIDVYDLPGRMNSDRDFADVVLGSYERDKKVWRVTRPDEIPPLQQEGFNVYGATILASNHSIRDDHPLASRCLRIRMPEAGGQAVCPALRGRNPRALKLRAELVAWAARWIASGKKLRQFPQVLKGRLDDIGPPLLQVAWLVYPDSIKAVIKWLQDTDTQRRVGESESREAGVVGALLALRRDGQWLGEVGVKTITERVNDGKEADHHISTQSISWLCKYLGLVKTKHGGYSYILFPGDEAWKALLDRYGHP